MIVAIKNVQKVKPRIVTKDRDHGNLSEAMVGYNDREKFPEAITKSLCSG